MLAELSARFLILPTQEVDGAITDALRQIVKMLGVDRAQLLSFELPGEVRVSHSWAVAGVPPVSPKSIGDSFPWLLSRVRAGAAVVIPRVDDLPPEAAVDKASFHVPGTKANLTVPMKVAGQVEGALAFGCLRHEREWPEALVERVRILAEVFANALAHKRTQEELDAAIKFERKASEILSALLGASRAQQDSLLEAGLRDVARVFGADRATLWQRVEAEGLFRKTHRWLADGVPVPADDVRMPTIPWISAQLEHGEVVSFARHDELPPSAATDVEALRRLRIGAAVIVPLRLSGQVVGALSIGTVREGPEWPRELVARVQLLGEAFASFLARQEAERREHMAQAEAAHAARVGTMGVFAASLVHELTQPLAASLSNAETAVDLLGVQVPDLEDLRATVSDIVADGRRAGEMIQKLRRFLRHGEAERREFDLTALLSEVLHFVKPEATRQGIAIMLQGSEELPHIVGDRIQLQQVLINLLLNAFEAVAGLDPGSRAVELRASPSEHGVRIEVIDCGAGMDEATLARIFRPFFTTKAAGMGLGLSISQTIVATHGGTLSAQSTPGAGSVFRIDLPSRPPLSIKLAPPAKLPAATGQTVFLIDDDDAMRRALERQLQGAGYEVEAFANARAFIDRAPRADVACIVSDVRMPGMSGLDLQATLARASSGWPIVFISGYVDIPTTVHAMKAGAVAFLPKPFAKSELLAAVADALARSQGGDQDRRRDAETLARHASLSPREHEVFDLVVAGLLNKLIADRLGIAEPTVKIHRGRMMEKMGARSVADLVRMAERIALHRTSV
ncbi:response regulator [Variovorax sp. J31P207]|uniref:response regulator n=1 Tax=Variovorax sp. J31P207 TaxID=3053510 RepID=UPI002577ACBA|nr:response regulator [Variovorax sp. J31P207]MDM0069633.1 response regulator [Variovorax sp. J31P207]